MVNKVKPQGRVLRHPAEGPSSSRTVAGTSTHVDATNKMMTGPTMMTPNMAFLDNYLPTATSDLNTPDIDLKAFDFGKENAKSKLIVTGMGSSNLTNSSQPFQASAAFFDMSISSPPSFGEDDPPSPQKNKIAEQYNSQQVHNNMMPVDHYEAPIPKAPLLTNTPSLAIDNISYADNPVTQHGEVPFDIPSDILDEMGDMLFSDVELGLNKDDQLLNSQNLDIYLHSDIQLENDILSQAIAGAELPSSEQLNDLLQTPGMMPPIIPREKPIQPPLVQTLPTVPVASHVYQDSTQLHNAPQEIIIPNYFANTSDYQTITYQVQEYDSSQIQQVQTDSVINKVQMMEVDTTPSITLDSESTNINILPSPLYHVPPSPIDLTEEMEIKPVIGFDAFPSTSSGKRRRAAQKPARFRDSIIESPHADYQPSTSVKQEKRIKLTDEEKYNRIRIMNNIASRKCRQRRKNDVKNMELEITDLEDKQKILKAKEAELTKQRDRMKALYCEFMKRQMAPR